MKKICLTLLILGILTSTANAYWITRLVPETYEVTVHPQPRWTCTGWVVPAPYREVQTRWVNRSYWVDPPCVHVQPPRVFVQPLPPPIVYGPPVHHHFCW